MKINSDSTFNIYNRSDIGSSFSSGKISFNKDTLCLISFYQYSDKKELEIDEIKNDMQNNVYLYLISDYKLFNSNNFPLKIIIDTSEYIIPLIKDTTKISIPKKYINSITIDNYLFTSFFKVSFQPYYTKNKFSNIFIIKLPPTYCASFYDFYKNKKYFLYKKKHLINDYNVKFVCLHNKKKIAKAINILKESNPCYSVHVLR